MSNNYMELSFKAISINEGFARVAVASFCVQLNPSIDEINDIKTSVSEAVTNCIVHAYPNKKNGLVFIRAEIIDDTIEITISDKGIGISDIQKAREPFWTSKPSEERSGMGFTVMESFMDNVEVFKNAQGGVSVKMTKRIDCLKSVIGG